MINEKIHIIDDNGNDLGEFPNTFIPKKLKK